MKYSLREYLLVSSIFLFSIVITRQPAEIYLSYVIFLFYLPLFFKKYGIPKIVVMLFIPIVLSGVFEILIGNNSFSLFLKVFGGLFLSVIFYYYVICEFKFDIERLFYIYTKFALIIASIGLIQVISFFLGFEYGYNYTYIFNKWGVIEGGIVGIRMNSIFSEPSYYAAIMGPAQFIATYNIFYNKRFLLNKFQSFFLFSIYFLTASSVGFISIFAILILLMINNGYLKQLLVISFIIYVSFYIIYNFVPEFKIRYDSTIELLSDDNTNVNYDGKNSSSVIQYEQFQVAKKNFLKHPLFGTGLGSHPIAFDRFASRSFKEGPLGEFNSQDANSMFSRMMSETGLYGIILLFFFIWKFKVIRKYSGNNFWIYSNSLIIVFFIYLIRQGNYFYNGFPFFIWLYFFVYKRYKQSLKFGL